MTRIESVEVAALRVPTDWPESDGTFEWTATTMVIVEISAGGVTGLGYSYTDRAAAAVINDHLSFVLCGSDAFSIPGCWRRMLDVTRNLGKPGIVSAAIAACDIALHDLKAKLLDVSVADLLGRRRERIPVYGSGGFTSYTDDRLERQLAGWAAQGIGAVKMKVGREPDRDLHRVRIAREAIGGSVDLLVDANGAYDRKQALEFACRFREAGVSWLEEPVSSNDLDGLRLLRDRAPPGLEIAAGEYGYTARYFLNMVRAGAVDVLQADATRCGGFTGFLMADAIAHAHELPLSSHTAPAIHLHCCCAALQVRHMEWFHDHVRIENMFFDGPIDPEHGMLEPDRTRAGLGLIFKRADAEAYRI